MKANGGHLSGRKWLVLFAGIVLDDADMIRMGGNFQPGTVFWQEDGQTFLVEKARPLQGYTAEMIGTPEWAINHLTNTDIDVANWISQEPWPPSGMPGGVRGGPITPGGFWNYKNVRQGVKYRRCCTALTWHAQTAAALLMEAKAEWGHDVYFDYVARYIVTEGLVVERGGPPWILAWTPWTLKMLRATELLPGIWEETVYR